MSLLRSMALITGLLTLGGCARPAETSAQATTASHRDSGPVALHEPMAAPQAEPRPLPQPVSEVAYPGQSPVILPAGTAPDAPSARYHLTIQQDQLTVLDWTQTVPGSYNQTTTRLRLLKSCAGKDTPYSALAQVRAELLPTQMFALNLTLDPTVRDAVCAVGGEGMPGRLDLEVRTPLSLKVGEHQTWRSLPQGQALTITLTRES